MYFICGQLTPVNNELHKFYETHEFVFTALPRIYVSGDKSNSDGMKR